MQEAPTLTISSVGLTKQDICVLRSLFAVTSGRSNYNYRLLEPNENIRPQIEIISEEEIQHNGLDNKNTAVTIVLGNNKNINGVEQLKILRPLTLSKVMGALSQATTQVVGDTESIAISDKQSIELLNIKNNKAEKKPLSNTTSNITALVVDDSMSVRKVMDIHLTSLGAKAILANTGEEALQLLQKQVFDIIFLDVVLPGMDGYQVCKAIRRQSQHKSTPICMLTSKTSTLNRVKGTLYGCDIYLTKPVQAKKLTELIAQYSTKQ